MCVCGDGAREDEMLSQRMNPGVKGSEWKERREVNMSHPGRKRRGSQNVLETHKCYRDEKKNSNVISSFFHSLQRHAGTHEYQSNIFSVVFGDLWTEK